MTISNVQHEGSWIKVYDEKGKKYSQMSGSGKSLVGIVADFFCYRRRFLD